jgi:hypothetical protein
MDLDPPTRLAGWGSPGDADDLVDAGPFFELLDQAGPRVAGRPEDHDPQHSRVDAGQRRRFAGPAVMKR